MAKKVLTEEERLARNAYQRAYKAKKPFTEEQRLAHNARMLSRYHNNLEVGRQRNRDGYKKFGQTPERIEARKQYAEENKEIIAAKKKEYREKNIERISKSQKEHRAIHSEKINAKQNAKRLSKKLSETPEEKAFREQYQKEYREANKEKLLQQALERQRNRRKNDPIFKLLSLTRSREGALYKKLKDGRVGHDGFFKRFGCDETAWKAHIESQFAPEMTWENWGPYWQLDHVLPVNLAYGDKDKMLKLCHYTNLRPLTKLENRLKSNNIYLHLVNPAFPYYADFEEEIMNRLKTQAA